MKPNTKPIPKEPVQLPLNSDERLGLSVLEIVPFIWAVAPLQLLH